MERMEVPSDTGITIWETANFRVMVESAPLVDRDDGGHVVILPKRRIKTRQELSAVQAVELTRLTMVVGEAMTRGLSKQGVPIGRINYQDNGNWGVFRPEGSYFHYHLFGRSERARHQPYGEALSFPHRDRNPEIYAHLKALTLEDAQVVRAEVSLLMKQPCYAEEGWTLAN